MFSAAILGTLHKRIPNTTSSSRLACPLYVQKRSRRSSVNPLCSPYYTYLSPSYLAFGTSLRAAGSRPDATQRLHETSSRHCVRVTQRVGEPYRTRERRHRLIPRVGIPRFVSLNTSYASIAQRGTTALSTARRNEATETLQVLCLRGHLPRIPRGMPFNRTPNTRKHENI